MGNQPIPPPMAAWSDRALEDCITRNRFAETWLLRRPHRARRARAYRACLLLIARRQKDIYEYKYALAPKAPPKPDLIEVAATWQ